MSTQQHDDDLPSMEPVPVPNLPWYETLRTILEPYQPAASEKESDQFFTSGELISSIEQHHGVPQGTQQGMAVNWIAPEDFVRAMRYLGYREQNTGGIQLQWLMKKK